MMVMSFGRFAAATLSMGLALEALAPDKISTVSYGRSVKDLNVAKFIATTPHLYNLYVSILGESTTTPRIGFWLNKMMLEIMNDEVIRTNTCLGYTLLTIPIMYVIKQLGKPLEPVELTEKATELVLSKASREKADDFYEALKTVNPSYTNTYLGKVPDIRSGNAGSYSLLDVLMESSYWDLIAYEITHEYRLTIDAYHYMHRLFEGAQADILRCISETQYYLLSKYLDTEVVKGFGMTVASFIKSYQRIINLLDDVGMQVKLRRTLDKYLRSNSINPGSIADILALAASLTLLKRSTFR